MQPDAVTFALSPIARIEEHYRKDSVVKTEIIELKPTDHALSALDVRPNIASDYGIAQSFAELFDSPQKQTLV